MAKSSQASGSTLTESKHGGRQHKRTQLEPTRAYLKRRWEAEVDDRKAMYGPQLDALEPFMIYVQSLVARHVAGEDIKDVWDLDGGRVAVFRSSTQITNGVYAAAVRWDCAGASRWRPERRVKANCLKHQKRVHRAIAYAGRLGLMEERQHQRNERGEGLGILMIVTPAGVAQSVEVTLVRRRSRRASCNAARPCYPAQRRVNLTGHLSYPLRESPSRGDMKSAGSFTDVTRRSLVARATLRKIASDANRRAGKAPDAPSAVRAVPLAGGGAVSVPVAQGDERAGGHRSRDLRRLAVADQLALWRDGA